MNQRACPSREDLSRFVQGTIEDEQASSVSQHIEQCSRCEATVVELEAEADSVVEAARRPVEEPHAGEPQCRQAVERAVEAGRELTGSPDDEPRQPPQPPSPVADVEADPQTTVFLNHVLASGLMGRQEVAELRQAQQVGRAPADVQGLARELVRSGKLTRFQAQALYQGRPKGLIFGDYVVLDRIGAGGMGQVFKAEHRRMKRIVAIKVLPPAAMKNADAVRRFQREVEAAARLTHPNIVTAYDAGEQNGMHYLVMEYVDGSDLSSRVKKHGPLPVEEAVGLIVQAARGLAYAHGKGVIHRDIKPGNLLVDSEGTLKILDMGLARFDLASTPGAAEEGLTQSGQVMGTVDYMAPEQALNTHQADARADIYSLGCTLYRLLTGSNVYEGSTLIEKILAHRDQPIPSLSQQRPEVSPPLESAFAGMMAKKPQQRFQTCDELIAALETAVAPHSGSQPQTAAVAPELAEFFTQAIAPTSPAAASRAAGTAGRSARPAGKCGAKASAGREPPWRRRGVQVAAAAAGALCLLLGITLIIRNRDNEEVARLEVPQGHSVTVQSDVGPQSDVSPQPTTSSAVGPSTELATPTASGRLTSSQPQPDVPSAGGNYELDLSQVLPDGRLTRVDLPDPLVWEEGLTVEMYATSRTADPQEGKTRNLFSGDGLGLKQFNDRWVWNGVFEGGRERDSNVSVGGELVTGQRVHLAGVVTSDGELGLFVNGQLKGWRNLGGPPRKSLRMPRLGTRFLGVGTDLPFDGTIDEVRISTIARYDGEFTPPQRFEPDQHTWALYHCDEGRGNVLVDSSGNERHGTIRGAAWAPMGGGLPSVPGISTDPDRAAAEWVLSLGGGLTIEVNGQERSVTQPADLPAGVFHVVGVNLHPREIGEANRETVNDESLAHLQGLTKLARLDLGFSRISDAGLVHLKGLANLTNLNIGNNGWITDAGLVHLEDLTNLGVLSLWNTKVSDRGLEHVKPLENLRILLLGHTQVGDAGLMHLADLTNLTALFFDSTNVTDAGLEHLKTLESLQKLNLSGTKVTSAGVEAFRRAVPGCDVVLTSEGTDQDLPSRTLTGHTAEVRSVSFSPDGRRIASGSSDRTVRLWDAQSGEELRRFEANKSTDGVWSVPFSPDGRLVATGSRDAVVRLWDAETGEELRRFEGHAAHVLGVALSPDGRWIASGSSDRTVRLWDAETGEELRRCEGHEGLVCSVAFSPDGRWIASASHDRTVRLWDTQTGEELRRLEHPEVSQVYGVAFSPDGRWIASASHDRTVRLWDAQSGAELRRFEGHTAGVRGVAFSPDGLQIASASFDKTVCLWDAQTGEELQRLEGHTVAVYSVAFSPDGRWIVSGSGDHTVRLWDVASAASADYALDLSPPLETGAAYVELPVMLRQDEPLTIELTAVPRTADPAARPMSLWHVHALFELLQAGDAWMFAVNEPRRAGSRAGRLKGPATVQPGRRVRLAGVSTGQEMRLFVDGELVGTQKIAHAPDQKPARASLGYGPAPLELMNYLPFDGTVDEIRISRIARYDQSYTPAARLQPDADTLALYHCDEGAGDTLVDSSVNNRHRKVIGAKWILASQSSREGRLLTPMEILTSPDLQWTEPENLGPLVNSAAGEHRSTLSPDGLSIFFVSDRRRQSEWEYWVSTRTSRTQPFGEPMSLGPGSDSARWVARAAFSADGLAVLFESSRPGGKGRTDLWMSTRKSVDDAFGEAVNLGPAVNSAGNDWAGGLSADGRILLFSANRPGGLGGHDLWITHRVP